MLVEHAVRRMFSLRRTDARSADPADRTSTWTREQEGRGTRLFLVHEGFDPVDPARPTARAIMGRSRRTHVMRAPGQTLERMEHSHFTSVTTGTPRVHVHMLMHLHVNRAMIPSS